jgi:hypothetical protein
MVPVHNLPCNPKTKAKWKIVAAKIICAEEATG